MSALKDVSMNTNLHAAFKREIDRLSAGVNATNMANPDARDRLARRYEFFSLTLHHHHEGEDTYLFERCKPRATPEEAAVLEELEAEHAELLTVLSGLDKQFAQLRADTHKDQLTSQLANLREVLSAHCAHEEADGMSIVQRYVTEADVKEFMKFTRTGETASLTLPWVCDGADAHVDGQVWGMLPPPVRLFVKPMMTRKYDKFTKACGI